MQRLRVELSRVAQERDSYKQKLEAIHRTQQQHQQQQHHHQQQQQQKNMVANTNRSAQQQQIPDGSPNYYL